MKKLTTLILAAGLVVSSAAGHAGAAEFKPFAQFAEEFIYGSAGKAHNTGSPSNPSYSLGGQENFNAATRIRFGFDYVASEDLSATMLFQYGHTNWGANNNNDFTSDPEVTGGTDHFRMRLAYIDWMIPTTDINVRMGRQPVVAPSYAFGSAMLDGRGDAVSITGAVNDNIGLGLTWLRIDSKDGGFKAKDDTDALLLSSEFAFDGVKVAPWAMYAHKQAKAGLPTYPVFLNNNKYALDAYILGASAELSMFDPFIFAVDALYTHSRLDDQAKKVASDHDFNAFYVGARASYKLDNGTASLGGWYASGSEINFKSGNPQKIHARPFVLLEGGFSASTILFGDNIVGADSYNTLTGDSPFGTWGLLAEYADFSFIENLSHTARVVYVQGTNDIKQDGKKTSMGINAFDNGLLTSKDHLVEVDFNSTYQIYKNLSATLELGYVFVNQNSLADTPEQDDIFRSGLTFVYNF